MVEAHLQTASETVIRVTAGGEVDTHHVIVRVLRGLEPAELVFKHSEFRWATVEPERQSIHCYVS